MQYHDRGLWVFWFVFDESLFFHLFFLYFKVRKTMIAGMAPIIVPPSSTPIEIGIIIFMNADGPRVSADAIPAITVSTRVDRKDTISQTIRG